MLVDLVQAISQRIQNEVTKQKDPSKQGNQIFRKCWNIIRNIACQKDYANFYSDIEQAILPLYGCMETPEKISFVDDILLFMNSMIRNSKRVSDLSWILVQTFPNIFKINNEMFNNLFNTLNLVIVYGKDTLKERPVIIDAVHNNIYVIN